MAQAKSDDRLPTAQELDKDDPYLQAPDKFGGAREKLGEIRYMGDAITTTYFGQDMERGTWYPCSDPHVLKKAMGNADIEVKGRDESNKKKEGVRNQRDSAQMRYIENEQKKKAKENKAADSVMGHRS